MNETIEYYNRHAEEFISGTIQADVGQLRDRFLSYVKPQGRILDAGCGSGRDTLAFMKAGYEVAAFDASPELCRRASELLGITVECKRLEHLTGAAQYDGIWACASLLHVKKADMRDVLLRLKKLLRPEGILYASFKAGETERVKDGRFFNDMTDTACGTLFEDAGFKVLELFMSGDVREGRHGEAWVNVICQI